jgi:hypothetical protein
VVVVAFLSSWASAQSFLKKPTVELFAGYSLLRYDAVPLGFSSPLNLNGGNLEVLLPDIYRGWGVTFDFSGHHSNEMEEFNFLLGPQYRFELKGMRFYGHGLWGRARDRLLHTGASQLEASTVGYAVALGGGLDVPWGNRFAIRPIQADYLISSAFGENRHSFRYSAGLVIRFGKAAKEPSF